ncbi:uncharacterized protein LOC133194546 [Saccostrea echinata]|uniref:uncharacterized protein LOC133194546 n=1 Tax=Saccostrea echinata TaxID=191078 RepID=UPI002A7F9674|nr:uncharacterized protein LOC133194546 [Saccostrea echinata]
MEEERDFVPDYEPEYDQLLSPPSRVPGSATSKRGKPCPICMAKFTHVKRHVIKDHLPWYTYPSTCCPTCRINFGQKHFLDVHVENQHNNNSPSQQFAHFWMDFMYYLFLQIIHILKLETFENLFKFINSNEQFSCCKGSVFQEDDLVLGEKFLKDKFPGVTVSKIPFPVVNASSLLHWKILSKLIDISNCTDLLFKVYKKYVVWILGSSIVHWAAQRAIDIGIENLEFERTKLSIFWHGIRGMKWESLLDTVSFCESKFPLPDFIIIHLGSNDIKLGCSRKLLSHMQKDLAEIRQKFPNCKLIFSELLTRLIWRGLNWEEGERERSTINKGMYDFIGNENNIRHAKIEPRKRYLFRRDGIHLSDLGNDFLLEDFKIKIQQSII